MTYDGTWHKRGVTNECLVRSTSQISNDGMKSQRQWLASTEHALRKNKYQKTPP